MTTLASIPNSNEIIAGISESGLWATADSGKTWRKLGEKDAVPIENRPYQIVFDPKDPKTFWESGNYKGPGIFKTADAGQTFTPLGKVTHVDGVGIDFTDPDRKTLVIGHHEQDRAVEKSTDSGQTWQKVGDKLPEHINFSNDVIVLDSKTYLVNAAGWKQENGKPLPFGIYRTEDAGGTWTKTSDSGPDGPACVASDGAIYWQTLWGAGLIKSADAGKTWQKLPGPVKSNPIEIAPQKLVSARGKSAFCVSRRRQNLGKIRAGITLQVKRHRLQCQDPVDLRLASTEAKEDNVIVRWDMP